MSDINPTIGVGNLEAYGKIKYKNTAEEKEFKKLAQQIIGTNPRKIKDLIASFGKKIDKTELNNLRKFISNAIRDKYNEIGGIDATTNQAKHNKVAEDITRLRVALITLDEDLLGRTKKAAYTKEPDAAKAKAEAEAKAKAEEARKAAKEAQEKAAKEAQEKAAKEAQEKAEKEAAAQKAAEAKVAAGEADKISYLSLQNKIIATVSQSVGNEPINDSSYWTYSVGADKNLKSAKAHISENLKQAGITDYGIQQILQKFEKSVTKISQDKAGPAQANISNASSAEAKKEALVNALKGIYRDALNAISGDIKLIKNNHASASKPAGLTDTEKQEIEKYKSTFCYHGGPLKIDDPQLKKLAGYRVVVLKIGNRDGNWKKGDIDVLRAAAKEQRNDNIQILSYISFGAADDADKEAFEAKLPNLKPKDIWMNPDRPKGAVQGAQINLSNPDVKKAWIKFKEDQIKEALGQNPGGGVFWDDSDVIDTYLAKFNDSKATEADKEKYQKAVNDFTDLYKSSCEAVKKENPKATIYQNRGDSMRDPNAYKVKNAYGWVNDTDDSVAEGLRGKYSSKTDEALKSNSSVTFENIQKSEEVTWKNRIMYSLMSEPPKFINIINYYKAEKDKNPSISPDETMKLIKSCCEEAATARKEMGRRQLSSADLQKFITVQYYTGPKLPMKPEEILPPPTVMPKS